MRPMNNGWRGRKNQLASRELLSPSNRGGQQVRVVFYMTRNITMEPITTISLFLATPIAKVILDKFYEGAGTKLGEIAVEKLPGVVKTKIQQLGNLVWKRCLQRASDTEQAQKLLQAAADGLEEAQENLAVGVNQVLEEDADFHKEVEQLATEINQQISIGQMNGGEVWNVFSGGKAQKNEFKNNKGPIYNNSTINYNGIKPSD
jgi:hypothetical protein